MDMEAFEWAQGRLRGLFIALHDRLGAQSLDQLNELVDAAELPLALEVFLQALDHYAIALSQAEYEAAAALAERMQVDGAYLAGVERRLNESEAR
jgi:hypothetical protein